MVDERNAQRGADVHKRRMNRTGYYTSNYFECIDSTCVRVSNDKQKYYLNIAAKIAVWYWQSRVKPNVINFNDTRDVTRYINPKLLGLADRHENFKDYKNNESSY